MPRTGTDAELHPYPSVWVIRMHDDRTLLASAQVSHLRPPAPRIQSQAALTLPLPPQPAQQSAAVAAKAMRFHEAWTASVSNLCASLCTSAAMRRRLSLGLSPKALQTAVRLALSEMDGSSPLLTLPMLENVLHRVLVPRDELTLSECSVVELLLLICLKKLTDKELPPPHTLRMVLREYGVFLNQCDDTHRRQYDYPPALLGKSFEHLCALGIVSVVRETKQRNTARDQLPLHLRIDSETIDGWLKSAKLPLPVVRYGTQWTL